MANDFSIVFQKKLGVLTLRLFFDKLCAMTYHEQRKEIYKMRIELLISDMPPFCRMFFFGREQRVAIRTLESYSYTIRQFVYFVAGLVNKFHTDLTLTDLAMVDTRDVQAFVTQFTDKGCSAGTVAEKIYTLNSFFKYFMRIKEIKNNPSQLVEAPRRVDKPIIRLNYDEISKILDCVNNTARNEHGLRRVSEKLLLRDRTILTLFLSTGIRLSELVGLDICDIDMGDASFKILRKGGKHDVIFMTQELIKQMKIYLTQLDYLSPAEPLFRNYLNTRLFTKSVQEIVKQYSKWAKVEKRITPHALRRTFGTNLYRKTRDISLVADVLGHDDVNTTKKHYAAVDDDIKRNAVSDFCLMAQ
jgi:site-specific recombinase XerD